MKSFFPISGRRSFRNVAGQSASQPLRLEGRAPTVVSLHGFTGVPGDVRVGIDVAQELGLAAMAPCLAGHGTHAGDLAQTMYTDWLESARPAFDEARARGPVILLGLSLGSLLATELTLAAPGAVAGLILIANAFWLKTPHPGGSLFVAGRLPLGELYLRKKAPDLGDPEMIKTHVTYDAHPIQAAVDLERAGRRLRKELFRIHRPTLILHGARDGVSPVQNSWRVAERLGTRDVHVVVYPRSRHVLTRDVERERVRADIKAFVQRISAPYLERIS